MGDQFNQNYVPGEEEPDILDLSGNGGSNSRGNSESPTNNLPTNQEASGNSPFLPSVYIMEWTTLQNPTADKIIQIIENIYYSQGFDNHRAHYIIDISNNTNLDAAALRRIMECILRLQILRHRTYNFPAIPSSTQAQIQNSGPNPITNNAQGPLFNVIIPVVISPILLIIPAINARTLSGFLQPRNTEAHPTDALYNQINSTIPRAGGAANVLRLFQPRNFDNITTSGLHNVMVYFPNPHATGAVNVPRLLHPRSSVGNLRTRGLHNLIYSSYPPEVNAEYLPELFQPSINIGNLTTSGPQNVVYNTNPPAGGAVSVPGLFQSRNIGNITTSGSQNLNSCPSISRVPKKIGRSSNPRNSVAKKTSLPRNQNCSTTNPVVHAPILSQLLQPKNIRNITTGGAQKQNSCANVPKVPKKRGRPPKSRNCVANETNPSQNQTNSIRTPQIGATNIAASARPGNTVTNLSNFSQNQINNTNVRGNIFPLYKLVEVGNLTLYQKNLPQNQVIRGDCPRPSQMCFFPPAQDQQNQEMQIDNRSSLEHIFDDIPESILEGIPENIFRNVPENYSTTTEIGNAAAIQYSGFDSNNTADFAPYNMIDNGNIPGPTGYYSPLQLEPPPETQRHTIHYYPATPVPNRKRRINRTRINQVLEKKFAYSAIPPSPWSLYKMNSLPDEKLVNYRDIPSTSRGFVRPEPGNYAVTRYLLPNVPQAEQVNSDVNRYHLPNVPQAEPGNYDVNRYYLPNVPQAEPGNYDVNRYHLPNLPQAETENFDVTRYHLLNLPQAEPENYAVTRYQFPNVPQSEQVNYDVTRHHLLNVPLAETENSDVTRYHLLSLPQAQPGNYDVNRYRLPNLPQAETENFDVTRYHLLNLPQAEPENSDDTRYHFPNVPQAEQVNSDITRYHLPNVPQAEPENSDDTRYHFPNVPQAEPIQGTSANDHSEMVKAETDVSNDTRNRFANLSLLEIPQAISTQDQRNSLPLFEELRKYFKSAAASHAPMPITPLPQTPMPNFTSQQMNTSPQVDNNVDIQTSNMETSQGGKRDAAREGFYEEINPSQFSMMELFGEHNSTTNEERPAPSAYLDIIGSNITSNQEQRRRALGKRRSSEGNDYLTAEERKKFKEQDNSSNEKIRHPRFPVNISMPKILSQSYLRFPGIPRSNFAQWFFDFYVPPENYLITEFPTIPRQIQEKFTAGGKSISVENGIIRIELHFNLFLDITIDGGIRLVNKKTRMMLSISANSEAMAILHPVAQIYQQQNDVDVRNYYILNNQLKSRFGKLRFGSVVFKEDCNPNVFELHPNETRVVADSFNLRTFSDYIRSAFLLGSRFGSLYDYIARSIIHTSFFRIEDNAIVTFINGMRIVQSHSGFLNIERIIGHISINTNSDFPNITITTPWIYAAASLRNACHHNIYLRQISKSLSFSKINITARNSKKFAGFRDGKFFEARL